MKLTSRTLATVRYLLGFSKNLKSNSLNFFTEQFIVS